MAAIQVRSHIACKYFFMPRPQSKTLKLPENVKKFAKKKVGRMDDRNPDLPQTTLRCKAGALPLSYTPICNVSEIRRISFIILLFMSSSCQCPELMPSQSVGKEGYYANFEWRMGPWCSDGFRGMGQTAFTCKYSYLDALQGILNCTQ